MQKNITKYLGKNPLNYPLESSSPELLENKYCNIIVIPAFAEMAYLPQTLESLSEAINQSKDKSLSLIVINNPPVTECDPAKFAENQTLLESLRKSNPDHTVWIDASSPGKEITKDGGVGEARKIGMDAALSLFDWNSVPLFFSLDADTEVEDNYISATVDCFNKNPDKFAFTLDFKHQRGDNAAEESAIRLYELYMKDYVANLKIAGSPYAYFSIGSTIVCRADKYVKAGGMRPKNGGEDFYFMQAVRKLSPDNVIGHTDATCVYPSSRASNRVPFGTGPRIADIISGEKQDVPGKYLHNPLIFEELKKILVTVENCDIITSFESWYEGLPKIAVEFLDSCGFRKIWPKIIRNTPNNSDKIKWAFHIWFDAFRTLKFIHFCEDRNSEKYGRIINNTF